MALITYTILSPLVGALIDRFGLRRVVVPGILLLSCVFIWLAAPRKVRRW